MSLAAVDVHAREHLSEELHGPIVVPTDAAYDETRAVFNTMVDKRPSVIAQCLDADDVARALAFAAECGLEVAVRGGGHGVAGTALSEGGLVVDLRRMNAVTVDPQAGTVTVGGGATMSDLDRATQPYGLATTGGRVSTTGVGGFTLGGGTGWLDRKLGLACDRLVSVDLVRADGSRVRASEDRNPELFWALHGGGGNFGVATSLTFRLEPLSTVTAGLLLWPAEQGPTVLRRYRDVMEEASDDAGGGFEFFTAPPEDFVPDELKGRMVAGIVVAHAGDREDVDRFLRPLLELRPPRQLVGEMAYADFQCMLDDPPGHRNYWSVEHLEELPDAAVDAFCSRAGDMIVPSPSQHLMLPLGARVAREGHEWPIPFRNARWAAHPLGLWADPADDERAVRWTKDLRADLRPWSTGAVYLNFTGDEGEERTIAGYGVDNYRRLSAVKAEHDPGNVFHLNHNIRPAPTIPAQR